MPRNVRLEERLAISRMLVSMTKALHANAYGAGANFGANVDGVFVALAVMIGHGENKPMSATKIALYLGMPRTTVLRKLDELERLGIVERRNRQYCITRVRLTETNDLIDRLVRKMKKYAAI